MAKKTDQTVPDDGNSTLPTIADEESHSLIEQHSQKENNKRVDLLEQRVSAIKSISLGLTNQLQDDKNVISSLGSGFDRTKQMLGKTFNKMDELVTKGSGSLWTYVAVILILILAILYKFG